MEPLLLVLACTSFYVELQYLNILKYLFKLIKFILKLLFYINYPIVYRRYLCVRWSKETGAYMQRMKYLRNVVLYGDVGIYECALLVLLVAHVLF
jgi:hypothetical protein